MTDASQVAIVRHLKQHRDSTVVELGRALGRTSVTVRHHLAPLQQAGLVEALPRRHLRGPGRPEKVYRLTPLADDLLPENYAELACRLVDHLLQTVPEAEAARILSGSARDLARRLAEGWPDGLPARRDLCLQALETRGYFPSWTGSQEAGQLRLTHCPYWSAAIHSPALCQFDTSLLGGLLGASVTLEHTFARGDPDCEFRVAVDTLPAYRIK
ncbi:MAG: ArsR family transcriptional regulator [Anaerolineales bacterium]|nr:ArsR family transcriptional regulator [Anaerolineales bacterium]